MTTLERWDESVRLLRDYWQYHKGVPCLIYDGGYWSVAIELLPLGLRTPHETAYGGTR